MPVYLKLDNPWWGNAHNNVSEVADEIGVDSSALTTRKVGKRSTVVAPLESYARTFSAHLAEHGYDSVVIQYGAYDYEVCVFDNRRIKSADPVTYDDNGNVIPLTERFRSTDSDIRHSRKTVTATPPEVDHLTPMQKQTVANHTRAKVYTKVEALAVVEDMAHFLDENYGFDGGMGEASGFVTLTKTVKNAQSLFSFW